MNNFANRYVELRWLQGEQQKREIEIEQIRIKKIYNRQSKRNSEKQIRLSSDGQAAKLTTDNALKDILHSGTELKKNLHIVYSILGGSRAMPKIACYVQESIENRRAKTDALTAGYSEMVNKLEENLAKKPGVRARKTLCEAFDKLNADLQRCEEKIHDEETEVHKLKQSNNNREQSHELHKRTLYNRLTAAQEEVKQFEFANLKSTQNETNVAAASQESAIGQNDQDLVTDDDEEMIIDSENISISPVKIDESVEFLSSQLSESSIHEAKDPHEQSIHNPSTSTAVNLDGRRDTGENVDCIDLRSLTGTSASTSESVSEKFVEPKTHREPKRIFVPSPDFSAKKPCYDKQFITHESGRNQTSTTTVPSNKRDNRIDSVQNVAMKEPLWEKKPEVIPTRKLGSHENQSDSAHRTHQNYEHGFRSGFDSNVPKKDKPHTIVSQPVTTTLNTKPLTSVVTVQSKVGEIVDVASANHDTGNNSHSQNRDNMSFASGRDELDEMGFNDFSSFASFDSNAPKTASSTIPAVEQLPGKSENNKNPNDDIDFDSGSGFSFASNFNQTPHEADGRQPSGFVGFDLDFGSSDEFL